MATVGAQADATTETLRGRPPSALAHAIFFRTLGTMFEAAVPLPKAMELLDEGLVGARLAQAAQSINRLILRGTALHEAMARQGNAFNALHLRLVHLGVQTGTLHKVLLAIAEHDERRHARGEQLKSALVYPCLVFLACLAFLILVPPLMFNGLLDMLASSGQPLPWLTRLVAAFSRALTVPWTYLGLATLAYGAWGLARAVMANPDSRWRLYEAAERAPVLGPVLVCSRLAGFTSALSVVMRSGLRLDRGLEIACRSCDSPVLERAAPEMVQALSRGDDLATLLRQSGLFPKIVWQATASGEESGQLPHMLEFLSRFYRADLENRLISLAAMLEPLVLGIMGLLVGGLMVACIKPLAASFAQF